MRNSQPVWTDHSLAKQQQFDSQSSIRVGKKGYRIEFQDVDSQQNEGILAQIKRTESVPINLSLKQSSVDKTPENITNNQNDFFQEHYNQEVIEAISFEHHPNKNQQPKQSKLQHILSQVKFLDKKYVDSPMKPDKVKFYSVNRIPASKSTPQKIKMSSFIDLLESLRKELIQFRLFMLEDKVFWVKQYKKIEEETGSIISEIVKVHEDITFKQIKKRSLKTQVTLENVQVNDLKEKLRQEKAKCMDYKNQITQLQFELKRNQISQAVKKTRIEQERKAADQLIKKMYRKVEQELNETKVEKQDAVSQVSKLKNIIRQKQHHIEMLNTQHEHFKQHYKAIKNQLDDHLSRDKKSDFQSTLLTEKHEQEVNHLSNEIKKYKNEVSKLKDLLKNSDEQLKQFEDFVSNVNSKIKEQQNISKKKENQFKEEQRNYTIKLQHFDKALVEVENSIFQMARNQEHKMEQVQSKSIQLEKMKEELFDKQVGLNHKQHELQELRNELRHEFFILERKQEGMRAQYKMAINAQNASKDKWYARYNQIFSDRKQTPNIYNSSPNLMVDQPPLKRQMNTKRSFLEAPVRQTRSPEREPSIKLRSEYNFSPRSPTNHNFKKKPHKIELKSPQTYRDFSISSRIHNIRNELDKQLKQMSSC